MNVQAPRVRRLAVGDWRAKAEAHTETAPDFQRPRRALATANLSVLQPDVRRRTFENVSFIPQGALFSTQNNVQQKARLVIGEAVKRRVHERSNRLSARFQNAFSNSLFGSTYQRR